MTRLLFYEKLNELQKGAEGEYNEGSVMAIISVENLSKEFNGFKECVRAS